MSAKSKELKESTKVDTKLNETVSKQYTAAKTAVVASRASWDEKEQLALTKLANTDASNRKSRISLGDLSTIVLERSGRTVAQLPSGKIRPVSEMDEGNCRVVELALQRYVIPNANSQFPLEDKLFLIDYFSDVYGGLDVLSFWRIDDEYVGPDCTILSPRDVFWQAGKRNTSEAEYVFVSTFVSGASLKAKKEYKQWDSSAINRVLAQVKDGAAKPTAKSDSTRQSINAAEKNQDSEWGDTVEIELVTKYERGKKGRWITFCPDYDNEIVRNIQNPDESGRIPVIRKLPQLPMIDSIEGQGAITRGASLMKTLDSVTNLTHDGLKYAVYPIQKYNGSLVSRSSMKWQAGAFWNMKDLNAVAEHTTGSRVLATFLPIQQFLTAKMLNQNGTTSTQVSESDKMSGYGKTPEALKMQDKRESTMDRLSRKRLESFWGQLMEHWISLLTSKQEKPIDFYIYDDEINQILAMDYDVKMNKGAKTRMDAKGEEKIVLGSGKLVIPVGKLKGQYKYLVDTASSMLQDEEAQHESAAEIVMTAMKLGPDQLNMWMAQEGESFSMAGAIKHWMRTGGLKDLDEIIKDAPESTGLEGQIDPVTRQPAAPGEMPPVMPPQAPPMQAPMGQPMSRSVPPMGGAPMQQQPAPISNFQPSPETMAIMEQIQQGGF